MDKCMHNRALALQKSQDLILGWFITKANVQSEQGLYDVRVDFPSPGDVEMEI